MRDYKNNFDVCSSKSEKKNRIMFKFYKYITNTSAGETRSGWKKSK